MKPKTRGLEPVVAVVLLIIVAVIGVVLVYLWFTGYITKTTSQADQITAVEKLKIDAANLRIALMGGSVVTLYVRNIGNIPVELSALYILEQDTNAVKCAEINLSVEINPKSVKQVTAIVCYLVPGDPYTIKLVTERGTEVATIVTATLAPIILPGP